jgi:hypothetical protein
MEPETSKTKIVTKHVKSMPLICKLDSDSSKSHSRRETIKNK